MRFTKMQGAGNDFVVVRTADEERDWSVLAARICDRHKGVGADGLLLLLPSDKADFRMRVINADGSESAVCGNGLRCLVRLYLDESETRTANGKVVVETPAGLRTAVLRRGAGGAAEIQVAMGVPRIGHDGVEARMASGRAELFDITVKMSRTLKIGRRELDVNLVSIGNPHAVHFMSGSVAAFPLATVGPQVERHRLFSDETNFEVARVSGRGEVEARVWERGCGETLACGSGACAITVAGRLLGLLDDEVAVRLPGGTLSVAWDGKSEVLLSGPAEIVFKGNWR
jgi:diaminopimelate epimerase